MGESDSQGILAPPLLPPGLFCVTSENNGKSGSMDVAESFISRRAAAIIPSTAGSSGSRLWSSAV